MLTAKHAIKGRCADCNGRACNDTTCQLYGLSKPKQGANRTGAIRDYCKIFCMHGGNVNQCTCQKCGIYQYRAAVTGSLHVDFLPQKGTIRDVLTNAKQKNVFLYGNGKQAPQNAPIHAREAV